MNHVWYTLASVFIVWAWLMILITISLPHDFGRWLAQIRNGYMLWIDK